MARWVPVGGQKPDTEPRFSRREAVPAALGLAAFAFAVYGVYIRRGGFTFDDWAIASDYERFGREHGVLHFAGVLLDASQTLLTVGGRPVAALYFAVTHAAFGTHVALYLALSVLLAALMSTALYVLLRDFRMPRLQAALISVLVLVFPAADSVRLWPAAAHIQLAIALYLLSVLLATRGLLIRGPKSIVFHAGSLALLTVSLLDYEAVAGGVLVVILLYCLRTSWPRALVRWSADLLVTGLVLAVVRSSGAYVGGSPKLGAGRARTIVVQAGRLFTYIGVQDRVTRLPVVVVALVVLISVAAALRLPATDPLRADMRRWLGFALAGLVAAAAGYLAFLPARDTFYVPLQPGIGNRTNIAAASGFVMLLCSLATLLALLVVRGVLVFRSLAQPRRWAALMLLAVLAPVGLLWVREVVDDQRHWAGADALNTKTLDALRQMPAPEAGATVYTFGVPGTTAPLVLAFTTRWDLTGAIRLLWNDQSLQGVPSSSVEASSPGNTATRSGIRCTERAVVPEGFMYSPKDASGYGRTIFVDVPSTTFHPVRDRGECCALVGRLLPRDKPHPDECVNGRPAS